MDGGKRGNSAHIEKERKCDTVNQIQQDADLLLRLHALPPSSTSVHPFIYLRFFRYNWFHAENAWNTRKTHCPTFLQTICRNKRWTVLDVLIPSLLCTWLYIFLFHFLELWIKNFFGAHCYECIMAPKVYDDKTTTATNWIWDRNQKRELLKLFNIRENCSTTTSKNLW